MLQGKKILVGVTGSIAAYKIATLVRLLKKSGAEVQVIMTEQAKDFISPLTLSTLSGNPVLSEYSDSKTGEWNHHVQWGLWPDVFLVAPATANSLAKMALGICDNFLMAVWLSARSKVMVAPAMDLDMWAHPSTQNNIKKLKDWGVTVIDPNDGELASGLSGKGRMAEPEELHDYIVQHFGSTQKWKGKKVLVTAGPTREYLDPVRYISNPSTGTMGYEIANFLVKEGATVYLVSGPVALAQPEGVHFFSVTSADEMFAKSAELHGEMDVCIFSAAVGDYKPLKASEHKIKKQGEHLEIQFVKNVDIAEQLGKTKQPQQYHLGFALESENKTEYPLGKLEKKNFNAIVYNTLAHEGAGFGTTTNQFIVIKKNGEQFPFSLKSKRELAEDLVNWLYEELS